MSRRRVRFTGYQSGYWKGSFITATVAWVGHGDGQIARTVLVAFVAFLLIQVIAMALTRSEYP